MSPILFSGLARDFPWMNLGFDVDELEVVALDLSFLSLHGGFCCREKALKETMVKLLYFTHIVLPFLDFYNLTPTFFNLLIDPLDFVSNF